MSSESCDIAIVGGGLAGTLIALRLCAGRPDLRLKLIERGPTLGGEHTWSFHDTDLTPAQHAWTAPLIDHRWPRQEVRFPAYSRTLEVGYRSITSPTLHRVASERLGAAVMLGEEVGEVGATRVVLAGGRVVEADAVIDARGKAPDGALVLGWQKFVGHEVRTAAPHGVGAPVIMDATVEQKDGYRFVYLLPFAPDRLLIEDTYYSDTPQLADDALGGEIAAYAAQQGWHIAETIRTERGVLPIALGGDIEAFWEAGDREVARAGLAAALFHPTTGYSLPDAVRLADALASAPSFEAAALHALTKSQSLAAWRRRGIFRFLNRMLFRAARPEERWRILERFYRLPEGLITRFYADRLSLPDCARILSGRPPVPVARALACLTDASASRP